jgi:FkbM family methyltransferase
VVAKRDGRRAPRVAGALRVRAQKVLWAVRHALPCRALMMQRVLAASEHRGLALQASYGTVIDVGAHRGQFFVFAAALFPAARFFCVEPQPEAREVLSRVANSFSQEAEILPYAAGAESSHAELHVSARSDSSSLLPIAERGQAACFPGTQAAGTLPVEVRPLDDLLGHEDLKPPVLLKLDVQGFELEALRGARRTLARTDDVLTEGSFRELYCGQPLASHVLADLLDQGFRLVDIGAGVRDRHGLIQTDFLMRRGTPHR